MYTELFCFLLIRLENQSFLFISWKIELNRLKFCKLAVDLEYK